MSNVVPINSTVATRQDYERRLDAAVADMNASTVAFAREFVAAMVDATLAGVDTTHLVARGQAAAADVMQTFTAELLRLKGELVVKYGVKQP